jgi:nucleoid-associated protein YgaU
MFAKGFLWVVMVAILASALALSTARPSQGAAQERRHVVQAGETLWGIAARSYGGDPREAVWRIEQRNGLAGATLQPGAVIYLPPDL